MTFLRILFVSTILTRCPCCGKGRLFRGWFAFLPACPRCGLVYEQWVGDWTTPTWIAHSIGFLGALAIFIWMFVTGTGMNGPIPPEFSVALIAGLLSLLALRPSKALWLGFMYWAGGVEVSARTRARLHWSAAADPRPDSRRMIHEAESRARRPAPRASPVYIRGGGLYPFVRDLLFPRPRRR
ncbi:MAG: DUF983 domain-containing protein [Deltaproteobacteria bacterium]|nr:DUF983 domain-containing protein [Deltaproteobacteria bacterium]